MTQTVIQKAFAPIKRYTPNWLANPLRSVATALIAPVLANYRNGFYRSCFKMAAVDKNGKPIPWYTYPAIDFLKYREYQTKSVLEFGAGQSTLWWAARADHVTALEGDQAWFDKIKDQMPSNVSLFSVSMESAEENVAAVKKVLEALGKSSFDILVIDGLYRADMIDIALDYLSANGFIVCDNADGYGFYEGFKDSGLARVDFFGNAPGVVLPHATSIYYQPESCFIFSAEVPIPKVVLSD